MHVKKSLNFKCINMVKMRLEIRKLLAAMPARQGLEIELTENQVWPATAWVLSLTKSRRRGLESGCHGTISDIG